MLKFVFRAKLIFLMVLLFNQCSKIEKTTTLKNPYFGQKFPGITPEVFAPDIITPIREVQNCLTISPDGKEIYWGLWNEEKRINKILFSINQEGEWTEPKYLFTSIDNNYNDDAPFLSPDGQCLYFISRRPAFESDTSNHERIWFSEKQNQKWSNPILLSETVNDLNTHMQFSLCENKTIYLISRNYDKARKVEIYYSKYLDGKYQKPVKLPPQVNSEYNELTPFISKDEQYLIFSRAGMPDGYGGADLFISFKKPDGTWTEAVNLGETINSSSWETCPIISPDGNYLFFTSNRSGKHEIFWVDAKIIKNFELQLVK